MSASTARGTCGGIATVAISSPDARAALRSSSASRIGATAMDSVTGPGTHQWPSRSQRHHQVDRVRLDAVELLGNHQRGHAQVGQLRPHLAAGCGVAGGPRPHRGGHVGGAERGVDAGREVALLFVESRISFRLFRGRPSSRSAMMLR